ncbi:MAG: RagB/SusD family nutrient uptake outer membrane protein, partial [Bacteroidales bacterium]|nr:RagB/SusD family nutrient uptake outer membrane protein [Bacteroidales bacterium]
LHYGLFTQAEEVMMDGFNAVAGFGNNYGAVHRSNDTFTSSDSDMLSWWGSHYVAIKNYNILIDALNDEKNHLDGYTAVENETKGFCYVFRAFSYLQLVRHFAKAYDPATAATDLGVPIVLHYDKEERPARSTVAQVYEQIKLDLTEAETLLSDMVGEIGSTVPTIDVVNLLWARYYLDIQDYANAASKAAALVDSKRYTLANSQSAMTKEFKQDAGTEPLMQLPANISTESPATNGIYTGIHSVAGKGLCFAPLFIPTKTLLDLYETEDLRRNNWFSSDLYTVEINSTYWNSRVYVFTRYIGNDDLSSTGYPTAAHFIKPFTIAEAYLIAAEAYEQGGDRTNAQKYLNALQQARHGNSASFNTSGSMRNIKKEWMKETVGQGLRMTCLKRWGDGFEGREPQTVALNNSLVETGEFYEQRSLPAGSYQYVWPIPAREIATNKNLVQNDGYSAN